MMSDLHKSEPELFTIMRPWFRERNIEFRGDQLHNSKPGIINWIFEWLLGIPYSYVGHIFPDQNQIRLSFGYEYDLFHPESIAALERDIKKRTSWWSPFYLVLGPFFFASQQRQTRPGQH